MSNITKENYPSILRKYRDAFSFSDLTAFMEFMAENDFELIERSCITLQLLKLAYGHSLLKIEMLEKQHSENRDLIIDAQSEIARLEDKIDSLNNPK